MSAHDTAGTRSELETDIERQREQLAQTVDQLAHKLDVKAQARERLAQAKGRATTASGRPRPALLAGAAATVLAGALLVWWRRR